VDEHSRAGLAKWLTVANVNQAFDLVFKWAAIVAALAAIEFFTEQPRATLGSVDATVRIDLKHLHRIYDDERKDIPPDLVDFAKWFNQEPDAIAPDFVDPHDRGRFSTPMEALDAELENEFFWAAAPFDEDVRQEFVYLKPPSWAWNSEKGASSKEYDFALWALADSQYGMFSVAVVNEGAIDIKGVVVSSLKDGMRYVNDQGQVTERMESDPFNLPKGKTDFVDFQAHFGREVSVVQGDLRRHFDIAHQSEAEFFNRSRARILFFGGLVGIGILALYGAWRVGAQSES